MIIRKAEISDISELSRIENECFSSPMPIEYISRSIDNEDRFFLVAEEEKKLLGHIAMMHVLDEGYILSVAADKNHRRRGIAKALLSALLAEAKDMKLSFVSLEVRASNIAAISLYESFGFQRTGEIIGYYERPKENALILNLYLEN
ncbi:ribosomal protein S18-alanine N-acetyltransferase [Clostridiaceae bacterium OttesenSCG-928-D20]|nr:ribosomal protein S18-alanine N-acetyltransferase [Clostridiaceae bacterium OttesenSCG-928-D20]